MRVCDASRRGRGHASDSPAWKNATTPPHVAALCEYFRHVDCASIHLVNTVFDGVSLLSLLIKHGVVLLFCRCGATPRA